MRNRFGLWVVLSCFFCPAGWGQAPATNPPAAQPSPGGQPVAGTQPSNPGAVVANAQQPLTQGQASGATTQQPSVPEIDGLYPSTVYPDDSGKYTFAIIGKNLPTEINLDKVSIEVVDEGPIHFHPDRSCPQDTEKNPCLIVVLPGKELSVRGFEPGKKVVIKEASEGQAKDQVEAFQPGRDKRVVQIQVRVDGRVSPKPASVTFARLTKNGVQAISLFVSGIFWVIVWLTIRRLRYEIDGKWYGPVTAFLLDKETNSYSLSKFQLVLWTAVVVFGYSYLFFCRTLIQGHLDWPAIPDNLPQMFGISAGATVAAAGITATRGSKGAGPTEPSVADFISTGGLVVGDRFQFFVWTLVGGLVFLSLLFQRDPAALDQLPAVPQNFLYLMGVSSAGYLGGKLVRKPGPVIKGIWVVNVAVDEKKPLAEEYQRPKDRTITYPVLTLKLEGENLDKTGSLKIDDQPVGAFSFWISDPQEGQPQNLRSELYVSLIDALKYLEGGHTLTLVNTDGQAADICFPKDPMTIESVASKRDGNVLTLTVTGTNFVLEAAGGPTGAEWLPDGADQKVVPGTVKVESATKLTVTVTFPAGQTLAAGTGTLTLISPTGLRTKKTGVTIT